MEKSNSNVWRWEEGFVNIAFEHLRLSYGELDPENGLVAFVSPPKNQCFTVQFLIKSDGIHQETDQVMKAMKEELDNMLVKLDETDPWAYITRRYCGTAGNAISKVHWGYYLGILKAGDESAVRQAQAEIYDPRYYSLVAKFKEQAHKEGSKPLLPWREVIPADFVFIGMEPSLGKWGKNDLIADAKIKAGFTNFAYSLEDFILHFCIKIYLCNNGPTYYLTDVSKGAMLVSSADKNRKQRYSEWLPLLKEELNIVSKPSTKLISIGKDPFDFLLKNEIPNEYILHYSPRTLKSRGKYVANRTNEYSLFKDTVTMEDIILVAKDVIEKCNMDDSLSSEILGKLQAKQKLTDNQKQLIFYYKTRFKELKTEHKAK